MQSFFLKILSQRCGRYVSIQLLQTLNILFENIKNETSICEWPREVGGVEEGVVVWVWRREGWCGCGGRSGGVGVEAGVVVWVWRKEGWCGWRGGSGGMGVEEGVVMWVWRREWWYGCGGGSGDVGVEEGVVI